jgi:hypothetical protein
VSFSDAPADWCSLGLDELLEIRALPKWLPHWIEPEDRRRVEPVLGDKARDLRHRAIVIARDKSGFGDKWAIPFYLGVVPS